MAYHAMIRKTFKDTTERILAGDIRVGELRVIAFHLGTNSMDYRGWVRKVSWQGHLASMQEVKALYRPVRRFNATCFIVFSAVLPQGCGWQHTQELYLAFNYFPRSFAKDKCYIHTRGGGGGGGGDVTYRHGCWLCVHKGGWCYIHGCVYKGVWGAGGLRGYIQTWLCVCIQVGGGGGGYIHGCVYTRGAWGGGGQGGYRVTYRHGCVCIQGKILKITFYGMCYSVWPKT